MSHQKPLTFPANRIAGGNVYWHEAGTVVAAAFPALMYEEGATVHVFDALDRLREGAAFLSSGEAAGKRSLLTPPVPFPLSP
jgi:hypothetical protein